MSLWLNNQVPNFVVSSTLPYGTFGTLSATTFCFEETGSERAARRCRERRQKLNRVFHEIPSK